MRPLSAAEYAASATRNVEMGGVEGSRPGIFLIRYPTTLPEVGAAQGPFPIAPGESFHLIIQSLGTFGEIGIGLALRSDREEIGRGKRLSKEQVSSKDRPGGTESAPKGGDLKYVADMVGWSASEVGFHGDHGRWYHLGKQPGEQISPPWEVGDAIECGLTPSGSLYFSHNGHIVTEEASSWPISRAYPTVTIHSGGAEVVLNLENIEEKSIQELGSGSAHRPASAWELFDKFRQTKIPEGQRKGHCIPVLDTWFGPCYGSQIQVAPGIRPVSKAEH